MKKPLLSETGILILNCEHYARDFGMKLCDTTFHEPNLKKLEPVNIFLFFNTCNMKMSQKGIIYLFEHLKDNAKFMQITSLNQFVELIKEINPLKL